MPDIVSPPQSLSSNDSAFAWSAALAGGVVNAALTLLLLAFGAGLGLSSVSPWSNSGLQPTTFSHVTGIYLVVAAMLASTIGGYMAGRLRTKWVGIHSEEVNFRDTAHGFVSWAAATIFGAAVLGAAATYIVGGTATGATQGSANQSGPTGTGYFVDQLLRPQPGAAAPAGPGGNEAGPVRAEVGRIFARSFVPGNDFTQADRAYLAQIVAARTGLSQTDAERRVDYAVTAAKAHVDQARAAAARLALWLTAAMLVGAFAASLAALEGGQLRDGRWKGVIGARNYVTNTPTTIT